METKARTVWACQQVIADISTMDAPSGRAMASNTLARLVTLRAFFRGGLRWVERVGIEVSSGHLLGVLFKALAALDFDGNVGRLVFSVSSSSLTSTAKLAGGAFISLFIRPPVSRVCGASIPKSPGELANTGRAITRRSIE